MTIINSTAATYPTTYGTLKTKVARIVGGAAQADMLLEAGEYINSAIIELNTRLYECNKIEPPLVVCADGRGTLPDPFFKEFECRLVDATGVKIRQLFYKDWVEFNDTFDLGVT